MGIGKMTIPLFLSTLPEGMTFTVNSIDANTPPNMYTYNMYQITLPTTFTASDIVAGAKNNKRGAKVAELLLQTDGFGFSSGHGGSFLIKFAIDGKPIANPEMSEAHITGTLSVSTSDWGTFTRPSQTNFVWTIDGVKPLPGPNGQPTNNFGDYSHGTPIGGYLEDSIMTVTAIPDKEHPEKSAYAFAVCNKQEWLVQILQFGLPAVLGVHVMVWGIVAGWAIASGGAVVSAVVWIAEKSDLIKV